MKKTTLILLSGAVASTLFFGGCDTSKFSGQGDPEESGINVTSKEDFDVILNLENGSSVPNVPQEKNERPDGETADGGFNDPSYGGSSSYGTIINQAPAHGAIAVVGQSLTYRPNQDFNGQDIFVATTGDPDFPEEQTIYTVNLNITPVPDAPTKPLGNPPTSVNSGQEYSYNGAMTDPDGGQVGYSLTGNPTWLTVDQSSGIVSGVADTTEATYNITLIGTDTDSLSTSVAFSLTVINLNPPEPPVVNGAPEIVDIVPTTNIQVNQPYYYSCKAIDPEGDPITYIVANKPVWLAFDAVNCTLSGQAPSTEFTYQDITINAIDDKGGADNISWSIDVFDPAP